jgi:CheY-like chemotaxis protein
MSGNQAGDALEVGLQRLRETARPEIEQRLTVIESCVAAWQAGPVPDDLWQVARRAAHQLAGSLWVLGFEGAGEPARRLNGLLECQPRSSEAGPAAELLAALRHELGRQPAPVPTAPSLVPTVPSAPSPVPTVLSAHSQQPPTRPARVLLADDDNTIAAAVQVSLQLDGVELIRARDGAEAVRLAREQDFDLILLDLEMPILDGFEVCRTLRDDPRLSRIPIVLITAQSDRGHIQARLAEGATEYLAKPFKVAELRKRIRTLLASRDGGLVAQLS